MMSKYTKRKQQDPLPVTLFTPETLQLIQQALATFEEQLRCASAAIVNRQLAQETLASLKGKLAALSAFSADSPALTFDRNEVVIMHGALQMYVFVCAYERKSEEIRQCCHLLAYFGTLLSS
jgi:hypothetical protein